MTDIEQRVATLEAEVAGLKDQLERSRMAARINKGLEELDRGEGVPAREAFEAIRKKYNIPTT